MKSIKKILAVLLSFITILSVASVGAFAEDTRIEVTELVGTSNFEAPVYGGEVKTYYKFDFTKGKEVRVAHLMSGWQKWNDLTSTWADYTEPTFTQGKYQFGTQIRIDETSGYGATHKLGQNMDVTINGESWNYAPNPTIYNSYSYNYIVSQQYEVKKTVNSISVTDIDIPVAGASPDTTATVENTFKIGSMSGIMWYRIENGSWISMGSSDVFEASNKYVCYMQVLPANYCVFPDSKEDFSAVINGETAVVNDNYSSKLAYIQKEYILSESGEMLVPETAHQINVKNGTSSVTEAKKGETVTLTANLAPEGKEFDKWVVTGADVADAASTETAFVMPARNVTAEATYKDILYSVLVINAKTSASSAPMGQTITVAANIAPEGKEFDKWVVTGATVADEKRETTTFIMPANSVRVEATYKDKFVTSPSTTKPVEISTTKPAEIPTTKPAEIPTTKPVTPPGEPALRPVTVVNGTTSSEYSAAGTTVYLTAEQIDGKVFSHWVVEGATVEDANAKETSFTMGDSAVNAEAIYTDCECNCHKGGIVGFFYKIILFFQKLFGNNLVCEACGAKH